MQQLVLMLFVYESIRFDTATNIYFLYLIKQNCIDIHTSEITNQSINQS